MSNDTDDSAERDKEASKQEGLERGDEHTPPPPGGGKEPDPPKAPSDDE